MKLARRVFLWLLLIFLFTSLTKNFFEYKKNYAFFENFKNEYDKANHENVTLKTEILKNSDPHQVERVIRDKLNLLKPNEITVMLPNPTPTPIVITPTPPPTYIQWIQVFTRN